MNSKGHFFISLIKSLMRIGACLFALATKDIMPMAVGFFGAELLGIMEETVDKR
jgi:hypothetical protein